MMGPSTQAIVRVKGKALRNRYIVTLQWVVATLALATMSASTSTTPSATSPPAPAGLIPSTPFHLSGS